MLSLLALLLSLSALIACACAAVIHSGPDIQEAIAKAGPGDTIIVGSGIHNAFEADKPLKILASGAEIHAAVQKPAIAVSSDGVSISGFKIIGMGKDTQMKFEYYMQNPAAAAGERLDLPNAAVIINGRNVVISNTTIFGAEVGVFDDGRANITLLNDIFESCGSGAILKSFDSGNIAGCRFSKCKKEGLNIEGCSGFIISNNSIINASNVGILLKESTRCNVTDNLFSGSIEGLALWNSTFNNILRNRADHSYYGIVLAESDNNTVMYNIADENSRNEIAKGFGVGISLQANSSWNVVAKNTAHKNFNGFEAIKGCKLNVIYGNNATDNTHGLRMDKNFNNLIFGNNFAGNKINAYENSSRNIWNNTAFGNFYGDYKGRDENNDGFGDNPYAIPGMESRSVDLKPMAKPYAAPILSVDELRAGLMTYARYEGIEDEEAAPYRVVNGAIVIRAKTPSGPPKFPASKPIFD